MRQFVPITNLSPEELIVAANNRATVLMMDGTEARLVDWPNPRRVQRAKINVDGRHQRVPTSSISMIRRVL